MILAVCLVFGTFYSSLFACFLDVGHGLTLVHMVWWFFCFNWLSVLSLLFLSIDMTLLASSSWLYSVARYDSTLLAAQGSTALSAADRLVIWLFASLISVVFAFAAFWLTVRISMSLRFAIFAMSCFRCLAASRSHSGFLWFSELADLSLFLVSFRCRRRRFACSPFPYVLAVVGVLHCRYS